jgi:hypothetical protein
MKLQEAISILKIHQQWRLGADIVMIEPKELTKALDVLINYHTDIMNEILSSQTEISDEEIEKGAWENPCLSRQDVYELFDEVFKDKTVQGIFKISVSKEVRQFKERLRQLAKEKYREQLKTK